MLTKVRENKLIMNEKMGNLSREIGNMTKTKFKKIFKNIFYRGRGKEGQGEEETSICPSTYLCILCLYYYRIIIATVPSFSSIFCYNLVGGGRYQGTIYIF